MIWISRHQKMGSRCNADSGEFPTCRKPGFRAAHQANEKLLSHPAPGINPTLCFSQRQRQHRLIKGQLRTPLAVRLIPAARKAFCAVMTS